MNDTVQWDKKYSSSSEEADKRLAEIRSGFFKSSTIPTVMALIHEGSRVLEIGCGTGQHIVALALEYPSAVYSAIDPSSQSVSAAKELAYRAAVEIDVREESAIQLSFESNTFDVVFGDQVIAHIRDAQKALIEIRRVLRPGGFVVMNVPNLIRWEEWPLVHQLSEKRYYQKNYFPWRFKKLFLKTGFVIISSYGGAVFVGRGIKALARNFGQKTSLSPLRDRGVKTAAQTSPLREGGRAAKKILERVLPALLRTEYGLIAQKPL